MTNAITGIGSLIERKQGAGTFEAIPETNGIAIPTISQDYVETTHTQSPDGFREYIKGLKDAGELSIPCNYTTEGYTQQLADQNFNGAIDYRVTLPLAPNQSTGDVFEFQGYPSVAIDPPSDPGGKMGMTVTIRTTGNFSFVAGS